MYNVAVSGMTGDGKVIASIAKGVAHDAAGNPNLASTSTDNSVDFFLLPSNAHTPAQITQAYGIDSILDGSIVGDGAGQTIAIIGAYDNPHLVSSTDTNGFASSDLHQFDLAFGLPDPPSFLKLDQNGGTQLSRP